MKKIFIASALFIGCNRKDDQLSNLISKRDNLKDSVLQYDHLQKVFEKKANDIAFSTHDTSQYRPLQDSQVVYADLVYITQQRIQYIQFSIDSLNKIKQSQ